MEAGDQTMKLAWLGGKLLELTQRPALDAT